MPAENRGQVYETGECEIDLGRRELRARGIAVPLGGRAFEIIEVLVQSRGALVTKNDLMDRVWPGAVIEENTLQVHISAVRRALGRYRGMLKTESGRGYRLLGAWTLRAAAIAAAPADDPEPAPLAQRNPLTNFPGMVVGLIGRAAAVQRLCDLLSAYRVVTLTGPGGIGKTALALEVARSVLADFAAGGWLVELAALSNPSLVSSAVARDLGLRLTGGATTAEAVARAIGERNILLVLDNCEHVIDVVADLAETIVRLCPRATVLATSREVLRIDGEYVYRVQPLAVPPPRQDEPGNLLGHGAVELFIARLEALDLEFSPDGERLSAIASICRHLDGIPLAIEFAAARAATLGIPQVATGLEDRFGLLTSGRRTALPRHQTLRAALDWSYELLTGAEQRLLRRLAVFPSGFTLEAAAAVTNETGGSSATIDGIARLVAKSLVTFDGAATGSRWRLLETIRAYAAEKLAASGEAAEVARRHAEYQHDRFARARLEWETQPTAAWLAEYGDRLDDLRAALDWAFSPNGDPALGVMLTADAVPLWLQFSLMNECRLHVEQALARLGTESDRDVRLRMRLTTALSLSRMYLRDAPAAIDTSWATTLALAERLGDADYQLRAIWGAFAGAINSADFRLARRLAERFHDLATDPTDRLIGDRIIGTALHFLGDQTRARRHIEQMLAGYTAPLNSAHIIRFQNDQIVAARRVLAPILWVQGFPDQAMRMVEEAVADAVAINHALTLCNLLAQAACSIAFLTGDLGAAERFTTMLIEHAARHSLHVWRAYGRCFEGMLQIRRGDFDGGLARLRDAGSDLRQAAFMQYYNPYLAALAEGLGEAGQAAAGIVAIDEALARTETTEERWNFAELLRVKGELLLAQGGGIADPAAEKHFRQAIDWARRQGALSWELRAATSLARHWRDRGRSAAAGELLRPVYDRFTEGFETADLRAAKALIESLQGR